VNVLVVQRDESEWPRRMVIGFRTTSEYLDISEVSPEVKIRHALITTCVPGPTNQPPVLVYTPPAECKNVVMEGLGKQ
jgi:hypothetical protein